jgi:hypothetical protein
MAMEQGKEGDMFKRVLINLILTSGGKKTLLN